MDKDFMQEELVSKELEIEINTEILKLHTAPCYDELKAFALHFIEWQKEQMKKDAVDGRVIFEHGNLTIEHPSFWGIARTSIPDMSGFVDGDNVKIIIVKEENDGERFTL